MAYEIAISLGLAAVAMVCVYLAASLKRDDTFPLSLLFIMVALYILLADLQVMAEIARVDNQTATRDLVQVVQQSFTWIPIVTMAYILIVLVLWKYLTLAVKARNLKSGKEIK